MHKIKKNIKKKIKGKKDKGKEDDLFDPVQLEKYRKELEEKRAAEAAAGGESPDTEDNNTHHQSHHQSHHPHHQDLAAAGGEHEDNEEWLKFKALTSGIDTVLQKTSGDLSRIKESSFFQKASAFDKAFGEQLEQRAAATKSSRGKGPQRPSSFVPSPSSKSSKTTKTTESSSEHTELKEGHEEHQEGHWVDFEKEGGFDESDSHFEGAAKEAESKNDAFKPPSLPKTPEELEDSLFDTSFVDAIAAGEIRLNYVPESPVEEEDGDDPFQVSSEVAVVLKRIEEEDKKQKRQVKLDCAVDFYTGKAEKSSKTNKVPTSASTSDRKRARPRPHAVNLLGEFDESGNRISDVDVTKIVGDIVDKPLGILDEDDPDKDSAGSPLLEKFPVGIPLSETHSNKDSSPNKDDNLKDLLSEFDTIVESDNNSISVPASTALLQELREAEEEELEDEFAALATESLHKEGVSVNKETTPDEEDPFNTDFVEKVAPHGKSELKIIENEFLGDVTDNGNTEATTKSETVNDDDDDFDFDPRKDEVHVPVSVESSVTVQKDLLSGDPTTSGEIPILPAVLEDTTCGPALVAQNASEVEQDPFDVSQYEKIVPGRAELKVLEEELLAASEPLPLPTHEIFAIAAKSQEKETVVVEEDTSVHPLDIHNDPVALAHSDTVKVLTPQQEEFDDPFNTDYLPDDILSIKTELKFLESELVPTTAPSISQQPETPDEGDFDFDPRRGEEPKPLIPAPSPNEDLFDSRTNEILIDEIIQPTQAGSEEPIPVSQSIKTDPEDFDDPFDVSSYNVDQFCKTELKELETELLSSNTDFVPTSTVASQIRFVQQAPAVSLPPLPELLPQKSTAEEEEEEKKKIPRRPSPPHLLETTDDHHQAHQEAIKVLTPSEIEIDPFDTSIANNIVPSKAELKLLEAELAAGNDLDDPDFDPRQTNHPIVPIWSQPLIPEKASIQSDTSAEMTDYTMASSKGFNPFLSEADYAPLPTAATTAEASNPFLSGFDTSSGGGSENPFLSYSASSYAQQEQVDYSSYVDTSASAAATNPFADFAVDTTVSSSNGPFSSDWSQQQQPVEPPVSLIDGFSADGTEQAQSVPQSTQFLLESVTGAMEAASDSLLLRVNAASPVPKSPDIPSPRSPSPDLMGELINVSDEPPPPPPPSANPLQPSPGLKENILDIFDTPSQGPKSSSEILGLYAASTNTVAALTQPELTQEEKKQEEEILVIEQVVVPIVEEIKIEEPVIVKVTEPVIETEPVKEIVAAVEEKKEIVAVEKQVEEPKVIPQQPVVTASPAKPAPERPKPPPARSPVNEVKTPSRPPPPPVPPAHVSHPPPAHPPPPKVEMRQPPPPIIPPAPIITATTTTVAATTFPSQSFTTTAPTSAFDQPDTTKAVFSAPVSTPAFKVVTQDFDDDFDAKFASTTIAAANDPFASSATVAPVSGFGASAWGGSGDTTASGGFGDTFATGGDQFDSFLAMTEPPPVPQSTPRKIRKEGDDFDAEDAEMSVYIRPKGANEDFGLAPTLAPPPKSPALSTGSAFSEENTTAFVPFLSSVSTTQPTYDSTYAEAAKQTQMTRTDSQETPQSPLFEEDTSQPLEDFPRTNYVGEGWEMQIRHPNKKKITGQRFWKKVYVRVSYPNETTPTVQIFNNKTDKDPFQEIPLQACYSVSEIGAQQFDQFGKIFTCKLQYIFYKERPGIRPGQISKAERITNKISQFAAYAIQGDYQGVKEFGSDLKKLGVPVEHSAQVSQLAKLGTTTFEELKQFSMLIEEILFKMSVHRDRAITYKAEEVQVTIVDEYYAEQDVYGIVTRQIARVRLFFLSFLSGMAEVELGVNDIRRQGKEVVGRHDIIPVPTEEWIRIEGAEFSNIVQMEGTDGYNTTHTLKFKPPDACYIELMRFRVRPPKRRELPLQVKTVFTVVGNRIEIRCDLLVPGFTSRKLGQIPCEDVAIRFPIPETWIYMFRVEKHFRYGSVKSAHRRSGKVKGLERILGAVDAVEQSLMEVTSGQAKYEHPHRAIVWRIPRLPKEGQGAYTTHSFFCHVNLQAHETIPDNLTKHCYVEFTMPHTTVSHTVCRSVSVPNCEEPPEKYVKYVSRHEYIVEIEMVQGFTQASYTAAAAVPVKKEEPPPPPPPETANNNPKEASDSDFSDD